MDHAAVADGAKADGLDSAASHEPSNSETEPGNELQQLGDDDQILVSIDKKTSLNNKACYPPLVVTLFTEEGNPFLHENIIISHPTFI